VIKPIQRFFESIKSEETRKPYEFYLYKFFKHAGTNADKIVKLQPKTIDDLVFDYLVSLKLRVEKETLSPNSINAMFAPIQLFLEQNDVPLNWKKLKRMFPRRNAPANQAPYHESEIRKILSATTSLRNKAFIHFLASTGCRVGVFSELNVSDLLEVEDGAVVTIYAGDIEEYKTCLTPEAYSSLKQYFEFRNLRGYPVTSNSPMFCDKSNHKRITKMAAKDLMRIILSSAALRPKRNLRKSGKGKSANHAYRKRFETVLVNAGIHSKYVDYMMGHKVGQDRSYFKPTEEELWKEFKKALPTLTVDKSEQLKIKNELQQDELFKYEVEAKNEIESLKKEMYDQRISTLKLISDALKNPEKFKEKLKD